MFVCWFSSFFKISFFASIADKWYRLEKDSRVILCFFASFYCCVSSCRSLIGDRSRGQVKRLSPMNVEVMGKTAADAGRWLQLDGQTASAFRCCCCQFRILSYQPAVMTAFPIAAVPLRDLNLYPANVENCVSS
jgi:hypothetical protein